MRMLACVLITLQAVNVTRKRPRACNINGSSMRTLMLHLRTLARHYRNVYIAWPHACIVTLNLYTDVVVDVERKLQA